ncbi:proline racemase family protein [Marinomonas sp. PE14-40]|uniref:proline racemase family protein n=1 Tax=Marinomonas sp. PE14-40 TaxID=3060621 RepID=UPI003F67258E
MHWKKVVNVINAHCEGENGAVVLGGVINVPGDTMLDKLNYLNHEGRDLQRFLCFEPRGVPHGSFNIVTPPTNPEADAGFIILQPDGAHPMSGSNAICVTTVLLETGAIAMQEPETIVTLDTAAGLVKAVARCEAGKCVDVTLSMVPSFVEKLDFEVTYQGKAIRADIAFGGDYYAIIEVKQLGLTIDKVNAGELFAKGVELVTLINQQIEVEHPLYPALNKLSYVMFKQEEADVTRTCTTLKPGRCDRSPCGTGSSAYLATLFERGLIKEGGELITQSIIGSRFKVVLDGLSSIGRKEAVLPQITGRGWIYGSQQLALDPSDPFDQGFVLSDTWGPYIEALNLD